MANSSYAIIITMGAHIITNIMITMAVPFLWIGETPRLRFPGQMEEFSFRPDRRYIMTDHTHIYTEAQGTHTEDTYTQGTHMQVTRTQDTIVY